MNEKLEDAVEAYFEDFVAAFTEFNGERVARKFSLPYLAKGMGAACTAFDSYPRLAEYFQSYLDDYYSQGCRECRYSNLSVTWLGSECAVASVTWSLLNASGVAVTSWTESYMLSFVDGKAMAFATVDHAGDS